MSLYFGMQLVSSFRTSVSAHSVEVIREDRAIAIYQYYREVAIGLVGISATDLAEPGKENSRLPLLASVE